VGKAEAVWQRRRSAYFAPKAIRATKFGIRH
jgi:hypothetical protein